MCVWIFPQSSWGHKPFTLRCGVGTPQVNHRQANEMVDQIRLSRVGSIFNGVGVKEPGFRGCQGWGRRDWYLTMLLDRESWGLGYIYIIHIY